MKIKIDRKWDVSEYDMISDAEEVSEAERYNRFYVIDVDDDLFAEFSRLKAKWGNIQERLYEIYDKCDDRRIKDEDLKYKAQSSGMIREEIVSEVNRRISCHADATVKCIHCHPGMRNPVGNCVVCGCGPSPASIEFLGLKPMLIHEVNAAFTN